jgi:hypothetical protein
MPLLRRGSESLDVVRSRIIHETEAALLYGLQYPDRTPRIPRLEVGTSRFEPAFAAYFWGRTLGIDDTEPIALDRSEYHRSTSHS